MCILIIWLFHDDSYSCANPETCGSLHAPFIFIRAFLRFDDSIMIRIPSIGSTCAGRSAENGSCRDCAPLGPVLLCPGPTWPCTGVSVSLPELHSYLHCISSLLCGVFVCYSLFKSSSWALLALGWNDDTSSSGGWPFSIHSISGWLSGCASPETCGSLHAPFFCIRAFLRFDDSMMMRIPSIELTCAGRSAEKGWCRDCAPLGSWSHMTMHRCFFARIAFISSLLLCAMFLYVIPCSSHRLGLCSH